MNTELLEQLKKDKAFLSSEDYPTHWKAFLSFISYLLMEDPEKNENRISLLDINCNYGIMAGICKKHIPNLTYTGIDNDKDSINLAKAEWQGAVFELMDYKGLTKEFIQKFDVILIDKLHSYSPNGLDFITNILSLEPKNLILLRLPFNRIQSYHTLNDQYDSITNEFRFNYEDLITLFRKKRKTIHEIRQGVTTNFLIRCF